jgi:hypothetical protein
VEDRRPRSGSNGWLYEYYPDPAGDAYRWWVPDTREDASVWVVGDEIQATWYRQDAPSGKGVARIVGWDAWGHPSRIEWYAMDDPSQVVGYHDRILDLIGVWRGNDGDTYEIYRHIAADDMFFWEALESGWEATLRVDPTPVATSPSARSGANLPMAAPLGNLGSARPGS